MKDYKYYLELAQLKQGEKIDISDNPTEGIVVEVIALDGKTRKRYKTNNKTAEDVKKYLLNNKINVTGDLKINNNLIELKITEVKDTGDGVMKYAEVVNEPKQ